MPPNGNLPTFSPDNCNRLRSNLELLNAIMPIPQSASTLVTKDQFSLVSEVHSCAQRYGLRFQRLMNGYQLNMSSARGERKLEERLPGHWLLLRKRRSFLSKFTPMMSAPSNERFSLSLRDSKWLDYSLNPKAVKQDLLPQSQPSLHRRLPKECCDYRARERRLECLRLVSSSYLLPKTFESLVILDLSQKFKQFPLLYLERANLMFLQSQKRLSQSLLLDI